MKAVIICIGDEILSGNTIDTNSNFIANQLKEIGIPVAQILVVADQETEIKKALEIAFGKAEVVISTGGLGPTRDDKTINALADFFNDTIIRDADTLANLKIYLDKRGRSELFEINQSQADILSTAKVILNPNGTAPCQMIKHGEKLFFCLPGVPSEVKPLIKDQIIPILKTKFSLQSICTRDVSVVGIPESKLAQMIEAWETNLPSFVQLSYLPSGSRIHLKLAAIGPSKNELENCLENEIESLKKIIGDHIISTSGYKIQEILKDVLSNRKMSISVAESCTGGGITRLITSVPGSSAYFAGGVVVYQTEQKTAVLGVDENLIQKKGVVSEEVASAMANHVQKLYKTEIAVSTTGVAGPGSDEFNSEIGRVYYSVKINDKEEVHTLHLPHLEREDFMDFVSQKVLQSVVERFLLK